MAKNTRFVKVAEPCKRRKSKGIASQVITIYRSLVRKIHEFWSWLQSPYEANNSLRLTLRIHWRKLDEHDQQVLSDYIGLLSQAGLIIREESPIEGIPNEYIGTLEWWDEGRLIYRDYLKIQEECVVRRYVAFQRIPEQALPAFQDEIDNLT